MRFLLLMVVVWLTSVCAVAQETRCDAPAGAPMHLPHMAANASPINILAIGSASLVGPADAQPSSLPVLLAERLRAALPHRVVTLRIEWHRGELAGAMLPALRGALAPGGVTLVLWQTGTVEAIHRTPPAAFRAALADGTQIIHKAGADAILISPLYSRRMAEQVDARPYRAALLEVARAQGAAVFDRSELMRGWAEAGSLDLDATHRRDRQTTMARVNACLASALARGVLGSIAP